MNANKLMKYAKREDLDNLAYWNGRYVAEAMEDMNVDAFYDSFARGEDFEYMKKHIGEKTIAFIEELKSAPAVLGIFLKCLTSTIFNEIKYERGL